MRILVVEDEPKVASFIKKGLEQEHYAVDLAANGVEGEALAESNSYDCIVLDILLPRKNGLEVLQTLRKKNVTTPILILTAKDSVEDRVAGLNHGSDDYLVKPFAFAELLARIRALLRRRSGSDFQAELRAEDLVMDIPRRKVFRAGKEIDLSNKEFALLEYLLRNKNQVVTRNMIIEHVWDMSFDSFTNVVDVYINFLRNKIDRAYDRKLIHTVRGVGYTLKSSE
ncbi:MAG TPA: response regulator transcription factor [Acidobacteriota bacterium]|jgi:heavy metal response regulator|nr:response regulator transcription factor [Acidobacteriota bacterium]